MSANYTFIINRLANSGRALSIIQAHHNLAAKILGSVDYISVDINYTLEQAITEFADTNTTLVICGGDGTLHIALESLINRDITIGYLPVGSGNDFSKSIGLSRSYRKNLKILSSGNAKKYDVVRVNKQVTMINTLGVGFDGQANYYANKAKIFTGSLRYMIASVKTIFNSHPFKAKVLMDGNSTEIFTYLAIIANGKFEGGKYLVSPTSDPSDGVVELLYTNSQHRFRIIWEFIRLSLGLSFSKSVVKTQSFKKLQMTFDSSPYCHADGELIKLEKRLNVEVVPAGISIISPITNN